MRWPCWWWLSLIAMVSALGDGWYNGCRWLWEMTEKCDVLVASGEINNDKSCMAGCYTNVIQWHEVEN
jgi:hypothetical protein